MSSNTHIHKFHHYIPQCYLKHFAKQDKDIYYIHTYFLPNNKIFVQNIDNVCGIKNFYKISEEYLRQHNDKDIDSLSIELNYFAHNVEKELCNLLTRVRSDLYKCIETNNHYFPLDDNYKFLLARHFVIQALRLPKMRSFITDFNKFNYPRLVRLFQQCLTKKLNNSEIGTLEINIKMDEVILHAQQSYMNEDIVNSFANHLLSKIWIFAYSPNGDFYTTDNPFSLVQYAPNSRPLDIGFAQYGSEIMWPLNPYLTLCMYDRKYPQFKCIEGIDGKIAVCCDELLTRINIRLCNNADKYIFSFNNDFSLATKLINIKQWKN